MRTLHAATPHATAPNQITERLHYTAASKTLFAVAQIANAGPYAKPQKRQHVMKTSALVFLLAIDAAALSQLPLSLGEAATVATLYTVTAAQLWMHLSRTNN